MVTKLSVQKANSGKWVVTSGQDGPVATYQNKVDAVAYARKTAGVNNVIIHNSAGQVLRPLKVKTSVSKVVMRNAVTAAIRRSLRYGSAASAADAEIALATNSPPEEVAESSLAKRSSSKKK